MTADLSLPPVWPEGQKVTRWQEPSVVLTQFTDTAAFHDPLMEICCREQKGYMSTPCAPLLSPGSMIMFPGEAVHCVTPYRGTKPRITLSWNLNLQPVAGEPLPESNRLPGQS